MDILLVRTLVATTESSRRHLFTLTSFLKTAEQSCYWESDAEFDRRRWHKVTIRGLEQLDMTPFRAHAHKARRRHPTLG